MNMTNLKATVAKVFTVGLLAGAVAIAAPAKADAQVAFGVRVGPVFVGHRYAPPVYVGPAYGYGYYGPRYYHYDRFHRGYWR